MQLTGDLRHVELNKASSVICSHSFSHSQIVS